MRILIVFLGLPMIDAESEVSIGDPRPSRPALDGVLDLKTSLKLESGSATVIAAFGMVAIMGMLALALDVGQLRYQQRTLQRAADAAALASVLELPYCNGSTSCSAMQTAATSALAENGVTGAAMVANCGTSSGSGLVLTLNNPPCAQGSKDPNMGKANSVEILLSQTKQPSFTGLLGAGGVPVGARAEASAAAGASCIYVLDPTGSNALNVLTAATVTSPCGIMVESSSSSAFNCALLGVVTSPQIYVVGDVSNFLCLVSVTPTTHVNVPAVPDPLSYLPQPAVPSCGTTTATPFHGAPSAITISGTATLYADAAYCGGITISSGANVTFQPGTYVLTSTNGGAIRSPGGMTINLGSSVSGTGVTFFNYGPSGGITFNAPSLSLAGVRLIAPTSGIYAGILFFQPSTNTNGATILGSVAYSTVLEGAYYFPKASVTFCFDGLVNYNILVAWHVTFEALSFGFTSVTSGFANNYSSLVGGSPLVGAGAILSQ